MVYVPMCLRASVVYVATCLRGNVPKACQFLIFTCRRASVPMACQCFNLACQCAKWCANFSTWRVNVPIFQTFLFEMLKEIYILYYDIKILHFTWYHSYKVITIICICIVNKTCIILQFTLILKLQFFTSCHTKERAWNFSLLLLLFFFSLALEIKI